MRFVLHINNRHTSGKWLKAANINLANINTTEMKNQKMLTNIKYRPQPDINPGRETAGYGVKLLEMPSIEKDFQQNQ